MAPDTAALQETVGREPETPAAKGGLYATLVRRLPPNVHASFSAEQTNALRQALSELSWGRHLTDIRLSIPLLGRRYYAVLLAGPERRNLERLRQERSERRLITTANLIFLTILVALGTILGTFVWTLLFVWYMSL